MRALFEAVPLLDVAFRRFFWSRIHFPEAEMQFLTKLRADAIDVSVDVGAALGGYAWILNRKSRRVIAFEPGSTHADFIARGLVGTNIELERKAVGKCDGTVPMYTPGNDTNARHSATLSKKNPVTLSDGTQVIDVPIISLDTFLVSRMRPDERLDFLKVDVEGYELDVFEGARARIASDLPIILCEIEARHNDRYAEVFELLRTLGYASYIFDGRRFKVFEGNDISPLQQDDDLAQRLSPEYRPGQSKYINNFLFSHPNSKIRIPV